MARYRWEPEAGAAGRYRDAGTGRFVAGRVVRRELDAYIVNSDDGARALARALRNREISLADWELQMRQHVKRIHVNAIAAERGGYANMRPQDYGRAGQIVREQYGYLRNFAQQVAAGTQRLDGTVERRASLYTEAARNSWYRSKGANLRPEVTHVRSIRSARDSCWQCVELHERVFRIGDPSFLLPGRRVCNHNCQCRLDYLALSGDGYETVETA